MISLVRVDDRLIHGQITVGWVPYLRADRIVVVNDRLAADPVLSTILKAGAPAGVRIDVMAVADTTALFREGDLDGGRVILLFESLQDVREAVDGGLRFGSLNLGGIRGSGEGLRVADAVMLTAGDREILRGLRLKKIAVEIRLMPQDRPGHLPEDGR